MGVYIEGMEMPKDGFVEIIIKADGTVQQTGQTLRLAGDYFYTAYVGERPPMYKAVPVPPHGRLGDLDALEQKIDGIWDCNDMVFTPDDHCCNVPEDCKGCKWVETKDCIQRMVANAPTIIPAEPLNEEVNE